MRMLPSPIAELLFRDRRRLQLERRLADAVLSERPLAVADVGSRGGIPDELAPVKHRIELVGFEADPAEAERLNESALGAGLAHRFLPVAVAGSDGSRTLYVTRKPASSSLLPPEQATYARFPESERVEVVREVSLETRAFGDVLRQEGFAPEMVKCDAQGLDGEILGSLTDDQWRGVLAVHVEINIARNYRGQASVGEVHGLLEDKGLELFSTRRYSARRAGFDAARFNTRGQITELDSLYMRPDPDAGERLAVVAALYRHYDFAHALLAGHPASPVVERLAARRFPRARQLFAVLADAGARLAGPPPSPWDADGPRDWV
jgi:FkbM family methyltransferase